MVLTVLASKVIEDKALIKSLCSEVQAMGSNYAIDVFQEEALARGRLEGEATGEAKGEAKGTRSGLLEALNGILSSRFGPVPPELRERLNAGRQTDDLKKLIPLAATCADLASFRTGFDRG